MAGDTGRRTPGARSGTSVRRDVAANRGTAASYGNQFFEATDTNGGTTYWSDGASWYQLGPGVTEARGAELCSPAEITANVTTTSTTQTDVAGLSITFTAPTGPFEVKCKFGLISNSLAGTNYTLVFLTGPTGTEYDRLVAQGQFGSGILTARFPRSDLAVVAGDSLTFKVQWASSAGGNTSAIFAGTTGHRPQLRAIST